MIYTKAIILAFLATFLLSCQEQAADSAVSPVDSLALTKPLSAGSSILATDDPGYVAEDPRLARLLGTPGPALSLRGIDGSEINLLDLYGKQPVLLKVWATYCIPCRVQMPGFEEIYQKLGDRIQVIAVNAGIGDDAEKVTEFVEDTEIHMPVVIDDGSLGAWLQMQQTPLHLLMGNDGRIVFAGHQDGASLHAALEEVLASTQNMLPIQTVAVEHIVALMPEGIVPTLELRSSKDMPVLVQGGASGRPRALFFTATWCEDYLLQTQPENAQQCQQMREQVNQLALSGQLDWQGIVTHLWTTPEVLATYEAQTELAFDVAVDTQGMAFRVFGISRLPAVVLIDAEGKFRGVVDADGDIAAAVQSLVSP